MTATRQLRADRYVIATVALVLLGAGVRLRQYAVNRSLWVDEAALALNITGRSFAELAQPLSYLQGAPPAFLWAVKLATTVGRETEPWLRLVPLLVSLAALVIFPFVARHYLSRGGVVLALALLVLSERLIYYASEVKQHGADVLVTVLILGLFVAFRGRKLTPTTALLLAASGVAFIWFSLPAIFGLAGVGLTGLIFAWRSGERRQVAGVLVIGLCWLAGFALVGWLSFDRLIGNEALSDFWAASGFPPALSSGLGVPGWFLQKYLELFGRALGITLAGVAALAGTVGAVSFYRRDRALLGSLALPIAFAMIAAILRLYPFADRLLLFTAPLTAILVAEGAIRLTQSVNVIHPRLGWLAVGLLLITPILQTSRLLLEPTYVEELRPVLAYVAENRQPGDAIYVYYGSTLPFAFYRDAFGIGEDEVRIGVQSRQEWEPYFAEMDGLARQGRRVWMVFSHVYHESGASEEALMINYLNHLGPVRSDLFRAPGAAVYFYDFTAGQP